MTNAFSNSGNHPNWNYDLKRELGRYRSQIASREASQAKLSDLFLNLFETDPRAFYRDAFPGHFTASALIVTPDVDRVLLTHHAKLNCWLQLGGHADGDPMLTRVAEREGREESGLTDLRLFPLREESEPCESPIPLIFDLDRHWIPERKAEPGHFHYDVRYVLVTEHPEGIVVSEESHELRWFALKEAYATNPEGGMHRLFDKLKNLSDSRRVDPAMPKGTAGSPRHEEGLR